MQLFRAIIGSAAILILISTPAIASVEIDFEGLAYTDVTGLSGDVTPDPSSVLTDNFMPDGLLFGDVMSAGVAVVRDSLAPSSGLNSVAGLDISGNIPGTESGGRVGDIYFSFVLPGTQTSAYTNYVSFTVGDSGFDLDEFEIRSYDLADKLIDVQNVSGISRFPVTIDMPEIHRVEVDFSGEFGYSLDDLSFENPVPEPSTILLFSLGGLAVMKKRRSRET